MSGDMEKYESCPHCGSGFPRGSGWNYELQRCDRCGLDRLRVMPIQKVEQVRQYCEKHYDAEPTKHAQYCLVCQYENKNALLEAENKRLEKELVTLQAEIKAKRDHWGERVSLYAQSGRERGEAIAYAVHRTLAEIVYWEGGQ